MKKHTQFPPILFAKAIFLSLKGNVHFPKDQKGSTIKEEEDFLIFRKVVVSHKGKSPVNPCVNLKVFFRFKRFSFRINRILSLIPIPLIIAQPGFRSKTWMTGKDTDTFHGLYEWDNIEDAKQYLDSLPLNMMKRRAIPETLNCEVIDTKD